MRPLRRAGQLDPVGPEEGANTGNLKAFAIPPMLQVYDNDSNLNRVKSCHPAGQQDTRRHPLQAGSSTIYDGAGALNFNTIVPNSGNHTVHTNSYT